jgi:hypothetical protein
LKRKIILIYKSLYKSATQKKHLNHIYIFFKEIKNHDYILIKKSKSFPNITQGSDFDLYVNKKSKFISLTKSYFEKLDNYRIDEIEIKKQKTHLDLYFKNKFIYKFDLIDSTHEISMFNKSFFLDALESKVKYNFVYKGKKMVINLPDSNYENLIRFVESREFPEKVHHYEYLDNLNTEEAVILKKMITKYTNFNNIET